MHGRTMNLLMLRLAEHRLHTYSQPHRLLNGMSRHGSQVALRYGSLIALSHAFADNSDFNCHNEEQCDK